MYDMSVERGRVLKVINKTTEFSFLDVFIKGLGVYKAVNYNYLTGEIKPGDEVLLNTTALNLQLGTGGYHFVCSNMSSNSRGLNNKKGHIMKLRYTPCQLRTLSVEEEDSPHHDIFTEGYNLKDYPVVLIPLHSLLAPLLVIYKSYYPQQRVVYIMTEQGSLSIGFSKTVQFLKKKKLLDKTITVGHSFGGDLEAINIFTALISAREVLGGDLIVVGMGPGIVGTGTRYGFSGIDDCFTSYAINIIGGTCVFVPRISFADKRQRHFGLSHHSRTILEELLCFPVELILPADDRLKKQLLASNILEKHNCCYYQIDGILEKLFNSGINFYSMGRSLKDDPVFFSTAGLAVNRIKELLGE